MISWVPNCSITSSTHHSSISHINTAITSMKLGLRFTSTSQRQFCCQIFQPVNWNGNSAASVSSTLFAHAILQHYVLTDQLTCSASAHIVRPIYPCLVKSTMINSSVLCTDGVSSLPTAVVSTPKIDIFEYGKRARIRVITDQRFVVGRESIRKPTPCYREASC